MADIVFQGGQSVVFIGDSITDCGRRDVAPPYGEGYVRFIIEAIEKRHPDRGIAWENRGIGGDTTLELEARWEDDALALTPDWLSCMIGINDLHQSLDGREGLTPAEYKVTLERLLEAQVMAAGSRLILLDPFYMAVPPGGNDGERAVLGVLPDYIAAVADLAEAFSAIHVRTQDAFQKVLQNTPQSAICEEPVHPNARGHHVIADAFLAAIADGGGS